ncbi:hypothetical protein NBRC3257_1396 [Gluconobacter thailandicus NBRC 3257]|uniref:Uncharacterized protein n=1 Tax=Gluconobacter thailandicus NBRC 3257 TaxID=1381097 RepID=A0ABQ0IW06_GLUTH|nr:hypothetical protein NBRC3255_1479 [Gluconobacter thailandicus NBRC 3255]GAD26397.1 hypothetical protein NBRC3257_1396 [Gluconobacter thailandicus NBRC 3257]
MSTMECVGYAPEKFGRLADPGEWQGTPQDCQSHTIDRQS